MPGVTAKDVHIDQLLTNISIKYSNLAYIADEIFPLVPVKKQSDKIPAYDKSHWFRNEARLRAPGTKSEGGGWTVDTSATYYCDRFSYRHEIDDETRDNTDQPFNLDSEATEFVTDKMQMKREVNCATDFFTTGIWTGDKVAGTDFTAWSDYGTSQPLIDLTEYRDVVEARIGREPNKLVFGKQVWNKVKWHPDLIDTIKYTQKGQVSLELFNSLAEFEASLIGRALYTTTVEGTAEASVTYTRIWGKHALMLYVPAKPSLMTPAAGYCFVWNRVPNARQYIKRFRDEEREVDIIEGNSYFDQKKTGADAGLFMQNVVA